VSFWENKRLYRLDPDFLVVRGSQTSLEEETNVFNSNPNPADDVNPTMRRWRNGPVFDATEAETWANLVVFCAGNIIAGDRVRMLNEVGLDILKDHLEPNQETAIPLDLGDGHQASVWYSQTDKKLLLLNLCDEDCTKIVDLAGFGVTLPARLSCSKPFVYENGVIRILLKKHESAVFAW